MRKALSLDGWLKEESLPEGWRVKRFSKNNITFVTDRGNLLRSQLEAIEYISTHLDSYTMSEIDQIKKYMMEIKDWVEPKKKPKKLKLEVRKPKLRKKMKIPTERKFQQWRKSSL